MRRRTRSNRIGTLLFLVPIVLIAAVVAYAIIDATASQNGTLIVEAQTSSRYYSPRALNVSVAVSGESVSNLAGTTPLTVTLSQGTYTVTYSANRWLLGPPPRVVNITAGGHSYAVGTYNPIPSFVSVAQDEFNNTRLTVEHGLTPVIWVNPSSSYVVISSTLTGQVIIPPLQNYTYVFQSAGTVRFFFPLAQSPNLVVVAI